MKKGQVTIFIIVGLFIAGVVFLMIYLSGLGEKEEAEVVEERIIESPLLGGPVQLYVEKCMEKIASEGVVFIGFQGGYHNTIQPFFDIYFVDVPYYFYENEKQFPTKSQIENELAEYIETYLHTCINNFTYFQERGYRIKAGEIEVETRIGAQKIIVEMNYPIDVEKGGVITQLSFFNKEVMIGFDQVYKIVDQIMAEQEKNPNHVPIGFLTELADEEDFTFEIVNMEEDTVLYSLIFNDTETFVGPYTYTFAAKYNWTHLR